MLSHGIGNSIEDLKYNFTIDQIYLFFEKCLKRELSNRKFQAICMAQAFSYASVPPMGADRTYISSKQSSWDKFIKSLEWSDKGDKQDIREVKKSLSSIPGIMVKVRKGDK